MTLADYFWTLAFSLIMVCGIMGNSIVLWIVLGTIYPLFYFLTIIVPHSFIVLFKKSIKKSQVKLQCKVLYKKKLLIGFCRCFNDFLIFSSS
jgi:hypothetical protein